MKRAHYSPSNGKGNGNNSFAFMLTTPFAKVYYLAGSRRFGNRIRLKNLSVQCMKRAQYNSSGGKGNISVAFMLTTPSAKVYLEGDELPSHPGEGWTRFVCISDTHSRRKFHVPLGDVLLHAGDLSSWGYFSQLETTIEWIKLMQHPTKIIIAGNHDLCLDEHYDENASLLGREAARSLVRSQAALDAGIHYLENESFVFKTAAGRQWSVHGSPGSPLYSDGAFQYLASAEEAQAVYNQVPIDTEILLTHTPPFELLDTTRRGKSAGCRYLAAKMQELKDCRLHVFGHIHEAYGACIVNCEGANTRVAVNAALYHRGEAVVVDLKD